MAFTFFHKNTKFSRKRRQNERLSRFSDKKVAPKEGLKRSCRPFDQGCSQMSVQQGGHSKAALKLIFLIKIHEVCRRDSSKNMSIDVFHFPISIIKLEFQPNRFSRMPIFHHFYPKINSNAPSDTAFPNIGRFNRKTINALYFLFTPKD